MAREAYQLTLLAVPAHPTHVEQSEYGYTPVKTHDVNALAVDNACMLGVNVYDQLSHTANLQSQVQVAYDHQCAAISLPASMVPYLQNKEQQ